MNTPGAGADAEQADNFAHLGDIGRATQAEVMGLPAEMIQNDPGSVSDLATKVILGDLWNRPGLSVRERRISTFERSVDRATGKKTEVEDL